MQEGPPRPADHFNLLPLPSLMSRGTHQCLSVLSWFLIPLSCHLLHLALFSITNIHIYRCSSLKVRKFISQTIRMGQFISKHTRISDNSSITLTKVGGTPRKPCKSRVNRVKVVFNHTRPYKTVLGTVQQLLPYNVFVCNSCSNLAWPSISVFYSYMLVLHSSLTRAK
jgi:hypothetical protein